MSFNRELVESQLKRVLEMPDSALENCWFTVNFSAKDLPELQQFCDAIGTKWKDIGNNVISTPTLGPGIHGVANFPPGTLGGAEVITPHDMSLVNRCES